MMSQAIRDALVWDKEWFRKFKDFMRFCNNPRDGEGREITMARLFIIGNGFDCAHGYHTKYKDFRDWMLEQLSKEGISGESLEELPDIPSSTQTKDGDLIYSADETMKFLMWLLQYNISMDEEWNKFEEALYDLDLWAIIEEATLLINEDDDQDDNAWIHAERDYEMYAEECKWAVAEIHQLFQKWMEDVELQERPISFGRDIICRNSPIYSGEDDFFLTFNYTETLEKVYKVPDERICHIHGKRNTRQKLIIGHGNNKSREFPAYHIGASDILDEAIMNLRKDTAAIIGQHDEFWEALCDANITEVYSFGFSFSEVDIPYIQKIIKCLRKDGKIRWGLNSFDRGEKNEFIQRRLRRLGFSGEFQEYQS